MILRALIGLAAGGGLGALMGHIGRCSSGTCPLTSTWWRGAIYGAAMGVIIALSSWRGA
jgi:hypothetical protein